MESLAYAWEQKLRHGEAVLTRPQQLQAQGRRRRYADVPQHHHRHQQAWRWRHKWRHSTTCAEPCSRQPAHRRRPHHLAWNRGSTEIITRAMEPQMQRGGDLEEEASRVRSTRTEGWSVARGVVCDQRRGQGRPELAGVRWRLRRRCESPVASQELGLGFA